MCLLAGVTHTYPTKVWEMENGVGITEGRYGMRIKKKAVVFFSFLSERYFGISQSGTERIK